MDEGLWKRNYALKTIENFNINDIIQAGLDNPDHPIGIIACSKDSYYTFDELLINAAKEFHKRNLKLTKCEKENFPMLKSIISNFEELFQKHLVKIEVQNYRNLSDFPFSSKIKRSDRRELEKIIVSTLKKLETDLFDENGKFFDLRKNIDKFL